MSNKNTNEPKITFHHQPGGDQSLGELITELARNADKIWIASAFLTEGGLKLLGNVSEKCKEIKIICGINGFITDVSALQRYVSDSKIMNGWVYNGDEPIFHPKLYVFHYSKSVMVIMGSANFTGQGIKDNNEIAVQFDLQENDSEFVKIEKYFISIKKKSNTVFEFLNNHPDYDEERKKNKKNMKIFHDQEIDVYVFNGEITQSFYLHHKKGGLRTIKVNDKINLSKFFKNKKFPIPMTLYTKKLKEGVKCSIGNPKSNTYNIYVSGGLIKHTNEFNPKDQAEFTINLHEKTISILKT